MNNIPLSKMERSDRPGKIFGEELLSFEVLKNYVSEEAAEALAKTIAQGVPLDAAVASEVANGMKCWALEHGVTHHCHWFQPLTGLTAEKHDTFMELDRWGNHVLAFSGNELIKGEADASSFPSGGIRTTFEARGYTVWDPTSPPFIRRSGKDATLYIPSAFYSFTGHSLDKKTPLLRSVQGLATQVKRLLGILGEPDDSDITVTLGCEQEYFLVPKELALKRPDLLLAGRTLVGCPPAKHQQMDDHYFGRIKPRVLDFMAEVDQVLWRLGSPVKTRHNEVAPSQFEIVLLYSDVNTSVDRNLNVMSVLREVADSHGFVCLLHEKPFKGVNGSGKHNNWSVACNGRSMLKPVGQPLDDLVFLCLLTSVIKAVDTYPELIRFAAATAGNDHRLGGNEAPPAVVSISLGEGLSNIVEHIVSGQLRPEEVEELLTGVGAVLQVNRDTSDRNRTSPFAYTGGKFEIRTLGASQNPSDANTFINAMVAQALSDICQDIEAVKAAPSDTCVLEVLRENLSRHRRVLFEGDCYSEQWAAESVSRCLPHIATTKDAIEAVKSGKALGLLRDQGVLSEVEFLSRLQIETDNYDMHLQMEADLMVEMTQTMVFPAADRCQARLADVLAKTRQAGVDVDVSRLEQELVGLTELLGRLAQEHKELGAATGSAELLASMEKVRDVVDRLECTVDAEFWPLPKYRELLFGI